MLSNGRRELVEQDSLPILYGDVRRLKQVMLNLVRNAIKFTTTGSIEIRACYLRHPDKLLVVHVIDTGKGIAGEDFPKLFSRFGKFQRTAGNNNEGIGLGLTIV